MTELSDLSESVVARVRSRLDERSMVVSAELHRETINRAAEIVHQDDQLRQLLMCREELASARRHLEGSRDDPHGDPVGSNVLEAGFSVSDAIDHRVQELVDTVVEEAEAAVINEVEA